MTLVYCFNAPAISCEGCVGGVKEKLAKLTTLPSSCKQTIKTQPGRMYVFADNALTEEQITILKAALPSSKQQPIEIEFPNTKTKPQKQESYYQYIAYGLLGCVAGAALLYFSMLGITLPLFATYAIDVASILLTIYLGWDTFRQAKEALLTGHTTMHVLFALNALIIIAVSMAAWFIPGLPSLMYNALLVFGFKNIGSAVERKTCQLTAEVKFRDRAPKAIEKLIAGQWQTVAVSTLASDDIIRIPPGVVIPVDGKCLNNKSFVYEDIVTGNLNAEIKNKNAELLAGMKVAKKDLRMTVIKTEEDSHLAVKDRDMLIARIERPALETKIQKWLSYFIPAVIVIAAITSFFSLINALNVLVGACPCVLGGILPWTMDKGLETAAQNKVNFKSCASLDEASALTTVMFDLTNTLTTGKLAVQRRVILDNCLTKTEFADCLHALEQRAEHPFADAIKQYVVKQKGINAVLPRMAEAVANAENSEHHAGVRGIIDGKKYLLGNQDFMQHHKVKLPLELQRQVAHYQHKGQHVIILAHEKTPVGFVVIDDPLRKDAPQVVQTLQQQGLHTILVTGTNEQTALAKAKQLGIAKVRVFAGCRNGEEKAKIVERFQRQGHKICFVGDGGNDAEPMNKSYGVTVQSSTTDPITSQAAQASILAQEFSALPNLFHVAKRVQRVVTENLALTYIYNTGMILLACGVLMPLTCIMMQPWMCVLAMPLIAIIIRVKNYFFMSQPLPKLANQSVSINSSTKQLTEDGLQSHSIRKQARSVGCAQTFTKQAKSRCLPTSPRTLFVTGSRRHASVALVNGSCQRLH